MKSLNTFINESIVLNESAEDNVNAAFTLLMGLDKDSDLDDIANSIMFNMIQYISEKSDIDAKEVESSLKSDGKYDKALKGIVDITKEAQPTIIKIKELQENPSLLGMAKFVVLQKKLQKTMQKLIGVITSLAE